jgi:hypothetical protein
LRPDSAIARNTLRPMRPNPLIATRIAMLVSPLKLMPSPRDARPAEIWTADRPVRPDEDGLDGF